MSNQSNDKLDKNNYDEIKESYNNNSYFKDSFDWYFFNYLSPICDRTLLIFSGLISIIVFYIVLKMIESTYPLIEEYPIFYKSYDQSLYTPKLVKLKREYSNATDEQSVDESVLKYLIQNYVKVREGFNFKDAKISTVNKKILNIKNSSSTSVYKKYQQYINKSNPNSPLNYFGQNVERKIFIKSVDFIRIVPKNLAQKAKEFIVASIPTKADIKFNAQLIKININSGETDIIDEDFIAKIDLIFPGIQKGHEGPLDFEVTNYQLFRIKK